MASASPETETTEEALAQRRGFCRSRARLRPCGVRLVADALYGAAHRAARIELTPSVAAGAAYCAEPICLEEADGRSRWIPPAAAWDLAHDRERGGYRGPAHARCNRAEGGRFRQAKARATPRRWVL